MVNCPTAELKHLWNNEIHKHNRIIAKKMKMQLIVTCKEHSQKIMIILNNEGCPLVPSQLS